MLAPDKDYKKLGYCISVLAPAGRLRLTSHDSDRVMEKIYDWVHTAFINKAEFYHLVEYVAQDIGLCH